MGFVNKNESKNDENRPRRQRVFIGRSDELEFFENQILSPDEPAYNILSICGDGGIGKSTLLHRYAQLAGGSDFKEFCLTALVDENQTTPASIMKRFAGQFREVGYPMAEFTRALNTYEETLRKLQAEREAGRDAFVRKASELAASVVDEVPVVGGVLKEGAKSATEYLINARRTRQLIRDAERLEDPIGSLTTAFVKDLNHLAESQAGKNRRYHRLILMFDTFEQLGLEAAPWLLDHFLEEEINIQIVLVIAGRDPVLHSGDRTTGWFEYRDNIKQFYLKTFTLDETRQYLARYNLPDPREISRLHELSGGLPFFLDLLIISPEDHSNPTRDVVKRFLRWIPENEEHKRRLAVDAAFFLKPFDQDDLEAFDYLPPGQVPSLCEWLSGLTFVRSNPADGKYRYHDLAQELFTRYQFQRSQKEYYRTRQALVSYYRRKLEQLEQTGGSDVKSSSGWQEWAMALLQQLLHLPDETSHQIALEVGLDIYRHSKDLKELIVRLEALAQEKSDNQPGPAARQLAVQLYQYIEGQVSGQEILSSACYLIEQAKRHSSFPSGTLTRLYTSRGAAYLRLNNYGAALIDFEKTIELDPNNPYAYARRGVTHRMMDNYSMALVDLDKALELDPNSTWIYTQRGAIYLRMNNFQAALADLDKALEFNSSYDFAYAQRGLTYLKMHKHREALIDFERALELDPDYCAAYAQRGATYLLIGNYQAALADFNRALELDPSVVLIDDLDKILELEPNQARTYAQRGLTYLYLADLERSRSDFSQALTLNSADVWYGLMLEWIKWVQDPANRPDPDRLEGLATLDPTNYNAIICAGLLYWQRGELQSALIKLQQATKQAPEEMEAYFWQGFVLGVQGQEVEALASIRQALAHHLPPVLLKPLQWLGNRPGFYEQVIVPLLSEKTV